MDDFGTLIAYVDGHALYDSKNRIISLFDSRLSMAAKKPNTEGVYQLFLTSKKEEKDNSYSLYVIELRKTIEGKVQISKEKEKIADEVSESFALAHQADNKNYWLVTHAWNSKKYLAYPIFSSGIGTVIESETDNLLGYNPLSAVNDLKFSSKSNKLAFSSFNGIVELLDFDSKTGKLSNSIVEHFDITKGNPYSLEFSSDEKKLYVSTVGMPSKILQYEVGGKTFMHSELILSKEQNNVLTPITLQMQHDGKIFINAENAIGLIEKPNEKGESCQLYLNYDLKKNENIKKYIGISKTTFKEYNYEKEKYKDNKNIEVDISSLIPNAFSPNKDGLNDEFYPLISTLLSAGETIVEYEFKITNRIEKLVFSATDINQKWDGKYHDSEQNSGVYLWSLFLKTSNNRVLSKNGEVALIR